MKTLGFVTMIGVMTCSAVFAGAGQADLNAKWDGSGTLSPGIGKVVYNVPGNNNKLNLTYILQGAKPNTVYTLGFDIKSPNPVCSTGIAWFGVSQDICYAGTFAGHYDSASVFVAGTVSTDADGDASFHINLLSLPKGTFDVIFWVVDHPPVSDHNYLPQAATASWDENIGAKQTIAIP